MVQYVSRKIASKLTFGLFTFVMAIASVAQSPKALNPDGWRQISDSTTKKIEADGKKIGYPGGTAGICVDRRSGDVYLVVPDQGLWKSVDHCQTFERMDGGKLGGRCETGFALNTDPEGGRAACFMLDGASALMSGGGKTWHPFLQHGRGWDYGAVDWSQSDPQSILAVHHESGEELHLSADGGKSWQLLGKPYTAIGIFDSRTFVASQGSGIVRSTDCGATWSKVSDFTPSGRVVTVLKGVGYWVHKEGILVSKDRGATWQKQGSPIEAAWGPYFGKTEKEIAVVGRSADKTGIWKSVDGGNNWILAAPFPQFEKVGPPDWTPSKQWAAGWFTNFGWDPHSNAYYASRMGHPALRWQSSK